MTEAEAISRLIPSCDGAPHKAIIWVSGEVHEITKHGECSGMSKYNIKPFPLTIDGEDKDMTIRKLNEALAELRRICSGK